MPTTHARPVDEGDPGAPSSHAALARMRRRLHDEHLSDELIADRRLDAEGH